MKKKKEAIVQADSEDGQIAGEAIVEAVENQIADNNPPETKQTLVRLMEAGESRENGYQLFRLSLTINALGVLGGRLSYSFVIVIYFSYLQQVL